MTENPEGLVCERCHRETDISLCFACVDHLLDVLKELAGLLPELEVQITKQAVGQKSPGAGNGEPPMMFDVMASDVLDTVLETLSGWCNPENPEGLESSRPISMHLHLARLPRAKLYVAWLRLNFKVVAHGKYSGAVIEEMEYLCRLITKAIDRKPSRIPLGVCECGRSIYADPDKNKYKCACDRLYDVADNRKMLRGYARELLVTAQQAAELGEIEGRQLRVKTIQQWARRKKLDILTDPSTGKDVYCFGDILDLAAKTPRGAAQCPGSPGE